MRIVIAPQAFKETLTGREAADAMAEGALRAVPDAELTLIPVADGGHGTLDALVAATGGQRFEARVVGPIRGIAEAEWGALGDEYRDTAVVEMARASGLAVVPAPRRNPMTATTYGTGQLIQAALEAGYRRIIVGVGGSATNDGGAGAAQALGVRLTDALRHDIPHGGEALLTLEHVDLSQRDSRLEGAVVQVAVDVSNPLLGPDGAVSTYAAQKGATEEQMPALENGLRRLAAVIQRDLGIDVRDLPGAGAAGGLAAGLVAFAGAELVPGAPLVCDMVGLDRALEGADLVITGEGRIDWQTVFGKAPIEVARRAAKRGRTVIAVGGSLGRGSDSVLSHGVSFLEGTVPFGEVPRTAAQAGRELVDATERAVRRALRSCSS